MAAVTLLETRQVSRQFGGLRAVDRVDFTLKAGEIRAIIGPNGAGKTTFVSLVCGRTPVSGGTILFDGRDVTALAAHERVGLGIAYTFQITSIYPNLAARENVALAAQSQVRRATGRADPRAIDALTSEALHKVGLADRADQRAGELSYGHQRLLEVAMGLALKPRLLILDEPTQGLSDPEIAAFIALVKEIAREATVLLIEHNMAVVMALAQRITVMSHGQILAEGSPDEIRANAAVQAAYLGTEVA